MIRVFLRWLRNTLLPIRIKGINNRIEKKSPLGQKFTIGIIGNNNLISIGNNCLLTNTQVSLSGDNNRLIIEDKVRFMGPCKISMGGNSTLHIKWNAGIRGVDFVLNGANIEIGRLCMFSNGITLRNHDSHKILDPETGSQLNYPKDIVLGDHVWIGQGATILKGCNIGKDSVIGFGSIVTKSCNPGSVVTGVPAKIVKTNITWDY